MPKTLHISSIYDGLLSCGNLPNHNKNIIDNIQSEVEKKVEKLFGTNRPIYIDIPVGLEDQNPPYSHIPEYMALYWIEGNCPEDMPEERRINEDGYEYCGFHLVYVCFLENISPESIGIMQQNAEKCFKKHAVGFDF